MKITWITNNDTDYVSEVKKCKTFWELKYLVNEYKEIVEDAFAIVWGQMKEGDFEEFKKQRNLSKPSIKWMKKYGAVLLPKMVLEVGLQAVHFNVPFGAMYLRMKEVGVLE